MSKLKAALFALGFIGVGAGIWGGTQYMLHETSTLEFCVSCHSMSHPQQEWEGSVHFSNRKGIRAECKDCHIPHEGFDYFKTKVFAVKDLWYTYVIDKLPDDEAFEAHRAEMAQRVWAEMKANNSLTCRNCHSFDAMALGEQKEAAQKMHTLAQETNQTCIDCHKGIAHFMPEIEVDSSAALGDLAKHGGEFSGNEPVLYSLAMNNAKLSVGGDVRLLPFAELNNWKADGDEVKATIKGWQQAGAESVVYADLGKRIMVALLGDDVKDKVNVEKTVYDDVTASDWKQVNFEISMPKSTVTANLDALNAFGNNLNQSHCSACHAPIDANHYTANQWIGVINSMKDRTSMSADDVRTVTIYLQRNAKDMKGGSH